MKDSKEVSLTNEGSDRHNCGIEIPDSSYSWGIYVAIFSLSHTHAHVHTHTTHRYTYEWTNLMYVLLNNFKF